MIVDAENDTKKPITSYELSKIFDRTYTIDESRSGGQTGLGLYIVKELMERQKGKVTAEYDEKKNVFRLSLMFKRVNSR